MSPSAEKSHHDSESSQGLDIPLFHSLVQLVRIAWRRKLLILLGVAVWLGLAAAYCIVVPPSYRSKAQLLVQRKGPRALPLPGVDPQQAVFQDSLASHQALLTSRLIAQQAIKEGDLTTLETLAKPKEDERAEESSSFSVGEMLAWLPTFGRTTMPREFDPAKIVLDGLTVSREVKDAILEDRSVAVFNIAYTCGNEGDSGRVVAAVIDGYMSYLDETHRSESDEISELYVHWRDDLKQELAAKQAKYEETLDQLQPLQWQSAGGINLSEQRVAEIAQQRLDLLVQLSQDAERLAALEKARAEGVSNQILFELVSTWTRTVDGHTSARDQLFDLILKEKQLVKTYGDLHREVEAIRDQIEIVAHHVFGPSFDEKSLKLMDPVEVYIRSLVRNVEVMKATAQTLDKLIEEEHTKAKKAHALNEELDQLRADVELSRSLQEQVVSQLKEVDIAKESELVEARVLAPPSPAELTLLSKPLVVFFVFGILGVVLGGGLVMLAETLDRSFRTPHELQSDLRLPVLGHIPYHRLNRVAAWKVRDRVAELDPLLVTYHDPDTVQAEAYRGLRGALYYGAGTDGVKVIQVTSPRAGEGKSVLAANLAISMAQSGKRVVLVGGDMRRPSLARLFGLANDVGLADLLADEDADFDMEAIRPTGVPRLDLLSSGPRPRSPGELLTSDRLGQLLERMGGEYDFILIDTPPLLAVSDASSVAAHVDGVLLTIRNSRNAKGLAAQAKEKLDMVGARELGVIVSGGKHGRGFGGYGYDDESLDWTGYCQGYDSGHTTDAGQLIESNSDGEAT